MKKKWNLYNISEARGVLMGIATLIVAYFHCYSFNFSRIIPNEFIASLLNFNRRTGNVGVDIFLFLSAIGLYFSFTKDSDIKKFYKKRLLRIVPSIVIVAIIYYLIRRVDFLTFIKGITLTNFYLTGNRDFWYFSLIIVLYLLYPLLYKIIDKKGLIGLLGLILISVGSTILVMYMNPVVFKNIEIALTRVPVFLIGIYLGRFIMQKKEIPEWTMILFLICFILCDVIRFCFSIKYYIIVRYMYCFYGISFIFLISYLHSKITCEKLNKFLVFMGTYSMEVYLIFEKLCNQVKAIKGVKITNYFAFYLVMFGLTMLLSYLLKKLCNFIVAKIEKKA